MPQWTLEYNGAVKTLAAWKLASPQLTFVNQASDIFTVVDAGASADGAPAFPYLAEIILRYGETIRFRGRRMAMDAAGSARSEALMYRFAGPWDYLEKITFHQQWKTSTGFESTSHVRVPARFDDNEEIEYITTGQQIAEVIDFINAAHGPVITKGAIAPALQIPIDEKSDQRCSEIVRLMLALSPDAICYFDYATTPPTFHCLTRPQLTAKNIILSSRTISALRLRPRDDLVPSAVVINYERTDVLDGNVVPQYQTDAAPGAADGMEYGAITQTVKLFGAEVVKIRGYVESIPIPATPDVDWFIARGLLKEPDAVITDFEFTGSDGSLPYEIVGGLVQPWMKDDPGAGGAAAVTFQDEFRCVYTYEIPGRKKEGRSGQVRINTTNIPTGFQSRVESSVDAEPVPVGLAAAVFNAMSVVPYEGSLVLTETEATGIAALNNTINITGGTGRYAAINALIQTIDVDLETGRTTLQFGPPRHLGLADLIEMLRFNRTRRVYTNPSVQQTGSLSASDVTLDGVVPVQNATSAPGAPDSYLFGGPNGTLANNEGIIVSPSHGPVADDLIRIVRGDLAALSATAKVKLRIVPYSERQSDGTCKERKIIILCSEVFD